MIDSGDDLDFPHVKHRIVIRDSRGDLGLSKTFRNGFPAYEIGARGAPRYRILTQCCDAPWGLEFINDGTLLPATSSADHAGRSKDGAEGGLTLLERCRMALQYLPPGTYLLCEFPSDGLYTRTVQMGNFMEDVPFESLTWGSSYRLSLTAFGRSAQTRADVSQVLVGVTLLRFTGNTEDRAVWFFNVLEAVSAPASHTVAVIVPLRGLLVAGDFCSVPAQNEHSYASEQALWESMAVAEIEKALAR